MINIKLLVNGPRNHTFLCKKWIHLFARFPEVPHEAVLLRPYLNLHIKVRFWGLFTRSLTCIVATVCKTVHTMSPHLNRNKHGTFETLVFWTGSDLCNLNWFRFMNLFTITTQAQIRNYSYKTLETQGTMKDPRRGAMIGTPPCCVKAWVRAPCHRMHFHKTRGETITAQPSLYDIVCKINVISVISRLSSSSCLLLLSLYRRWWISRISVVSKPLWICRSITHCW